jgi:hypothetical protein
VEIFRRLANAGLAGLDLLGLQLLTSSMEQAAKSEFPAYQGGGYALGILPPSDPHRFHWAGFHWTTWIVTQRLLWLLVALLLALLAAAFFDRFDPARVTAGNPKRSTKLPTGASGEHRPQERTRGTMLPAAFRRFAPAYRVWAELQLLLNRAGRLWLVVALGLAIGGFFAPSPDARGVWLLVAWVWPVLIWSSMGSREAREGTREIVFACSHPLLLQLPAQWLAGFLVAVLAGSGVLLQLLASGDTSLLGAWLAAAVFIPSLALMLGVVTGVSKVFEVTYLLLCYFGPLNNVHALDFIGMGGSSAPAVWLLIASASLATALLWRWRQLNR